MAHKHRWPWMRRVRVLLRDTQTGDEAWHEYDVEDRYADSQEFWWTDGNGACDCNRMGDLARALGREDPDLECGHDRIVIAQAEIDGVPQDWR